MLPELYPVMGSPPRVRSRLTQARRLTVPGRITSACAEQTSSAGPKRPCRRDHLRVCGADIPTRSAEHDQGGSPPRVRSRWRVHRVDGVPPGITSACAEQTRSAWRDQGRLRDHLRVCGADPFSSRHIVWRLGSPPRVRSRPVWLTLLCSFTGITSACAEQTWLHCWQAFPKGDHLRVCGADWRSHREPQTGRGSPPRVRSRPIVFLSVNVENGITLFLFNCLLRF